MVIKIFVRASYQDHQPLVDGIASMLEVQGWRIPVVVVDVDSDDGFATARKMGVFVVPTIVVVGDREKGSSSRWDGTYPTPEEIVEAITSRRRAPAC